MTEEATPRFVCGRRQLLIGAGVGGSAVVVAACGASKSSGAAAPSQAAAGSTKPAAAASSEASQTPSPSASPTAAKVKGLVAVADIPAGAALAITDPKGRHLLISRSGSTVIALDATCTHMGCTVAPKNAELVCPCHASTFALSGSVMSGPAPSALHSVAVRVTDGQVVLA